MKEEYEGIVKRLDRIQANGEITEHIKQTIKALSDKVIASIAEKFENIRKGVGDIMGGKILDYEAKEILNQGKKEGRNAVARNMIRRGKQSLDEIAEDTGLELSEVEKFAEEMGVIVTA